MICFMHILIVFTPFSKLYYLKMRVSLGKKVVNGYTLFISFTFTNVIKLPVNSTGISYRKVYANCS